MRVGVLGANGFVGKHLRAALTLRGDRVVEASLRDPAAAAGQIAGCDTIVNLSGEPIAQRWTREVKVRIENSRVEAPRRFQAALGAGDKCPQAYISASAIGFYGTSEDATFTESDGPGGDFLARVCAAWELQALEAAQLGMRVAIVRTGLALGVDGGALARMLPPFRLGLGGIIGNGRQWYSWIHIDDLVGIYLHAIDGADGVLNATAPVPVRNADFTRELGRAISRPTFLKTPTLALRAMLGEGAAVVLNGQRVLPQRTQSLGYRFAFNDLERALSHILS